MNEQRLYTLFCKRLENGLSAEEEKEFLELFDDAEDLALFEEVGENLWRETEVFENKPSLASRSRIHRVLEKIEPEPAQKIKKPFKWSWMAAAASVLLVMGLLASQWTNIFSPVEVWYTVSAEYGKQKKLLLPDSTVVHLHAGTTLRYSDAYNEKNREVELDGEAFFDVVKNPDKPFIVHSGALYTKVLGTSFNVNAFGADKTFQVTVISGKVEVGTMGDAISAPTVHATLFPNDQLSYDLERRTASVKQMENLEPSTSWMKNTLVFDDLRLAEVAVMLERWYNVEVVFFGNEKLKEQTFTGSFAELSLRQVMDLLRMTGDFNYVLDGRQLRIESADVNQERRQL